MGRSRTPSLAEAAIALAAVGAIVGVFLPWESLGLYIRVEIRGFETLPGKTVLALGVFGLAAINVSTVSAFGIVVVLAAGAAGTIVGWAAALRRLAFR